MADKESKFPLPLPALIGLLLVAGSATGVYLYSQRSLSGAELAAATAEAKAYTRNLKLANVEMKAAASYLGQEVVEILGQITNAGDRGVRLVELTCIFYDPRGTELKRSRVPIVKASLKTGETRSFRLPFDDVPAGWNQTLPQLVIARIVFD